MVEEFRPYIDAAVLEVVEECLEASDEDDVARAGGSSEWPAQIDATVKGMAEVLARDNIQMAEGAKQAFLNASIEAVARVNSGDADREAALHRAVRKLERDGIEIITYQDADTGRVTVRNKADVAVRRHVRTQIAQDAARLTIERMKRLGIDLVEVSSHEGSRKSHAEWQGQCYSYEGEQVIDGTVYPDLRSATGYGNVDGLLGANCRHSFGPYRHGAPRMYDPDPKTASGLPNDEVYELTQGQRYRERKIREAKRELRGCSTTATRATRTWPSTLRRSRSCSGARRRCASTSAPPTRRARPGSQCCTASPTASGPATCRRAASRSARHPGRGPWRGRR